jgi:hypothetical protein
MNLDRQAILFGAGVIVATSVAMMFSGFLMPVLSSVVGVQVVGWSMTGLSLLGRLAGGLVAGWIAQRDGILHGLVVGALGAAASLLLTSVRLMTLPSVVLPPNYWLQVAVWAALGVALSTLGGYLAVLVRSRR